MSFFLWDNTCLVCAKTVYKKKICILVLGIYVFFIFVFMKQSDKLTYVVPMCQAILLASESGILSGSTKDVDYEDI